MSESYCTSRFETVRRISREVRVGNVGVGGTNPIRVQSMTTTPTLDVDATVRQCIALAEAGCEIVRVTAQNVKAAEALKSIRAQFSTAGFAEIPLVADIHFLPQAAMEAALHVEKVRINPGNYADKKKFQVREYSDSEYAAEVERLHEAFSPIVLRCKELGRAMRIGTNHGSLSDRIMNRYGDTPEGMCQSALEFLRIAEDHGFRDIVISMKASNPKVMIQAYRIMVRRMLEEDMHYPLHLGVTEAGDGDDARIKSAIGIGGLLVDGLGDTIRVSLTEDPVYEVPVARDLARKAERLWRESARRTHSDAIDPYHFQRRNVRETRPGNRLRISALDAPIVIQPLQSVAPEPLKTAEAVAALQKQLRDARIEGLMINLSQCVDRDGVSRLRETVGTHVDFCVWAPAPDSDVSDLQSLDWSACAGDLLITPADLDADALEAFLCLCRDSGLIACIDALPSNLPRLADPLTRHSDLPMIFSVSNAADASHAHAVGVYRQLNEVLQGLDLAAPIWIRNTSANRIEDKGFFGDALLEASIVSGSLICDGIGDLISIETVGDPRKSVNLAYDVLQGCRARTTKTEYVACPSCGRTLFDLQTTTQRIREATGHLKGVTIAVMGCIVNGPGEMADADFGYVGGAPGKVNLYVGKECVKYHIPADQAVDELINLIREHGKWQEPVVEHV